MKKTILSIALVAATLTAPIAAQARDHDRGRGWSQYERSGYRGNDYRGQYNDRRAYDDRRYSNRSNCRSGGTTGLLLGGVAGALLGRAVDTRGERTTGTVLGAGAGALLGREVERSGKC
ncbi:MAG: glycine zipper 2TM domain-containing protein [Sphingobium sp.]